MVDLGVALTWIAISAASAKGLSVLARAAVTGDANAETAALAGEVTFTHEEVHRIGDAARLLRERP